MNKKILTLALVHQHPKILLGLKKKGFGAGRWNGFGGKVEPGETIEAAALRELQEECGIRGNELQKKGVLTFSWATKADILEVHVFSAPHYTGEPAESDEMKPQWFHVNEIPYDTMWSDDRYWLPLLLAGKKFEGNFTFDDNDQIINYKLHSI